MVFLTNNLEWSAQTIADLYRCRWSIEVFFKELKQTLQLADFLGHNANAVRWQVWIALLVYLLLRFGAFLSQWGHSFTRLFALIRSALWQKLEVRSLLEVYGTAGGGGRCLGTPQQAYLPGINYNDTMFKESALRLSKFDGLVIPGHDRAFDNRTGIYLQDERLAI